MPHHRKQFVFDLYADKNSPVLKYYASLSGAYEDIRKYMTANGFSHRQGSSYISNEPMSERQVKNYVKRMCKNLPWMAECSKEFDVANIGTQHSLMTYLRKACDIYADEKREWTKERENSQTKTKGKNNQGNLKTSNLKDKIKQAKNASNAVKGVAGPSVIIGNHPPLNEQSR